MTAWRMAFRVGNQGYSMWPQCLRLGVAAITYEPLLETDLSRHPEGEPRALWNKLEPTQKASLRRVAYEMKAGDIIYVKDGPRIVDKGIVAGPADGPAYFFDRDYRVLMQDGRPWAHQVRVDWSRSFDPEGIPILLGGEQVTVKELSRSDVERLEMAIARRRHRPRAGSWKRQSRRDALIEEAYYRESPARLKVIVPRHNQLSNSFVQWLDRTYGVSAVQEQDRIDIQFRLWGRSHLAELKVCFGVGPRKSVREALGQLCEYNHYPRRRPADVWLIVLDEEPSEDDITFLENLRETRDLPVVAGWPSDGGFRFGGDWPRGPRSRV